MPKSSKPHWLKRDNIPEDPYEFEEHDARSLSDGKIGATPGSGRLFPGHDIRKLVILKLTIK